MFIRHKQFATVTVLSLGLSIVLCGSLSAQNTNVSNPISTAQSLPSATSAGQPDSVEAPELVVPVTRVMPPSIRPQGSAAAPPQLAPARGRGAPARGARGAARGAAVRGRGALYLDFATMDRGADDPEMRELLEKDQELDQKTREIAEKLRGKSPDLMALAAVGKSELTVLLEQHFDVRQQIRSLELERLEEKLARLREVIKRRDTSRELIVGKRLSEMLGEAYELDF